MFIKTKAAYTLVELMIALGIIGILTLGMIGGYSQTNKNERFSGNIKTLTQRLNESKTKAYTTETAESCPVLNCYWRGTLVEINHALQTYETYLLYGQDTASYASQAAQQRGLQGKVLVDSYQFEDEGLVLAGLNVGGVSSVEASLVFLAPNGRAYTDNRIVQSGEFNLEAPTYTTTSELRLTITDQASSLSAEVTFNPANGMISTSIN